MVIMVIMVIVCCSFLFSLLLLLAVLPALVVMFRRLVSIDIPSRISMQRSKIGIDTLRSLRQNVAGSEIPQKLRFHWEKYFKIFHYPKVSITVYVQGGASPYTIFIFIQIMLDIEVNKMIGLFVVCLIPGLPSRLCFLFVFYSFHHQRHWSATIRSFGGWFDGYVIPVMMFPLPSDKLTVGYWKWPIYFLELPIKMVIFHSKMLVYQMVTYDKKAHGLNGWPILVGGLGIIFPTDELIFFRGVAQPPTRIHVWHLRIPQLLRFGLVPSVCYMTISEADALAAHKAMHEGKDEVKLESLGV